MDDRPPLSAGTSRKRHRPEDRSPQQNKYPTSVSMPHVRDTRPRTATSAPIDVLLPIPPTDSAPMLQPLYPPIPNFTAISQGTPRPPAASVPTNNNDHQGATTALNAALPLPNPGRAHRFCQVCDHINHVRRKLCELCGAPKPSAARNAVGLRPAHDPEHAADRRHRPPPTAESYEFEGVHQDLPRNVSLYNPVSDQNPDMCSRVVTTHPSDQRAARPLDPVAHQAHPMRMRGAGDDMPLLGISANRTHGLVHYQYSDPHTSSRLGMEPPLLGDPLINFPPFQSQDPRMSRPLHRPYSSYPSEREPSALPSMNGALGSHQLPLGHTGQTAPAPARATGLDMPPPGSTSTAAPGRNVDGTHAEEGMSLSRSNFIQDGQAASSHCQNFGNVRHSRADAGSHFPETIEGHASSAYAYAPQQDLFSHHSSLRPDERASNMPFEETRLREGIASTEPLPRSHMTLNRYMIPHVDGMSRHGEDRGRASHGLSAGRGEAVQGGHLSRAPPQPAPSTLEEPVRPGDDGRLALESILMPPKDGRHH